MSAAKTPAQRQAARKARLRAAGLVQFKCWAHPDDALILKKTVAKLARLRAKRERAQQANAERSGTVSRPVE
jgi:hypothetical protein